MKKYMRFVKLSACGVSLVLFGCAALESTNNSLKNNPSLNLESLGYQMDKALKTGDRELLNLEHSLKPEEKRIVYNAQMRKRISISINDSQALKNTFVTLCFKRDDTKNNAKWVYTKDFVSGPCNSDFNELSSEIHTEVHQAVIANPKLVTKSRFMPNSREISFPSSNPQKYYTFRQNKKTYLKVYLPLFTFDNVTPDEIQFVADRTDKTCAKTRLSANTFLKISPKSSSEIGTKFLKTNPILQLSTCSIPTEWEVNLLNPVYSKKLTMEN